jgi:hypothetical protein
MESASAFLFLDVTPTSITDEADADSAFTITSLPTP